jgi:hypothetical protein
LVPVELSLRASRGPHLVGARRVGHRRSLEAALGPEARDTRDGVHALADSLDGARLYVGGPRGVAELDAFSGKPLESIPTGDVSRIFWWQPADL